MGRAYTIKEKEEINRRMKDIARELFRERGLNDVSIMDITQAVGISQGGFYNFYESKEKLLLTIMLERVNEKQQVVMKRLYGSEMDPKEFLLHTILYNWKKLKDSKALLNMDSGIFRVVLENKEWFITNQKEDLRGMLRKFREYWEAHAVQVLFDTEIVIGIFYTTSILYINQMELPKKLSEELAEEHARHMIQKYVVVKCEKKF